jgi:hypothetical protein
MLKVFYFFILRAQENEGLDLLLEEFSGVVPLLNQSFNLAYAMLLEVIHQGLFSFITRWHNWCTTLSCAFF